MTTTTNPVVVRDDLFTHIHKGLRLDLFNLTVAAGRTDWTDPAEVAALEARWRTTRVLLDAHTSHEDEHIFTLLDAYDPMAAEPNREQHRDLDALLDDLDGRFDGLLAAPDATQGLALYRDLARFVAAYLPHLHDEETRVMARIWECCTDDEIAAGRAAFMADTTPGVMAATLECLLPALDRPTRRLLVGGLAAASPDAVGGVVAIAERVLTSMDLADLHAAIASVQ